MSTLIDIIKDALREPGRVALTLFGIVLGAASIVFLGSALEAAAISLSRLSQDASGEDISNVYERPVRNVSQARTFRFLSDSDLRALAEIEGLPLTQTAAANTLYRQEGSRNGKTAPVGVQGGGTEYMTISGLELLKGRLLLPEEDGERVAVIGIDVWRDLFDSQWPVADARLTINGGVQVRVVGVLKSRPPMGGGGDGTWMFDRKVYVSNTTLRRAFADRIDYDDVYMRHTPPADGRLPDMKAVAERLTPVLETLHLGVRNFEFAALNQGQQLWMLITYALGGIMFASGFIAMLVGGVNVMNAQLVSLHEKTKEFGIRRALGLSKAGLQSRVVAEAAVYASLGGATGVLLGLFGAWAIAALLTRFLAPWPFLVVPWSIIAALGSAACVGLLAGLLPAYRAGRLVPSECLREE